MDTAQLAVFLVGTGGVLEEVLHCVDEWLQLGRASASLLTEGHHIHSDNWADPQGLQGYIQEAAIVICWVLNHKLVREIRSLKHVLIALEGLPLRRPAAQNVIVFRRRVARCAVLAGPDAACIVSSSILV